MTLAFNERIIWALLACALALGRLAPDFRPTLSNDSFQYLSVARNSSEGALAETSIVHFDAERSTGRLPAPMVTFPPGYPLAITAVAASGLDFEHAAGTVSLAALLCTVLLVPVLASRAGLRPWPARLVTLASVVNASLLSYAGSVASESLFTAVLLLAFVLLGSALRGPSPRIGPWLFAGLAFGVAYWIRYAGLFVLVGLVAATVWYLVRREWRAVRGFALVLSSAGVCVLLGFLRNIHFVGNWKGGNGKLVHFPVTGVLFESLRALRGVTFGPGESSRAMLPQIATLLLLLLGTGLIATHARALARPESRNQITHTPFALTLVTVLGVYCALMFYAGVTTVISYGERMFVPVIPIAMVLLGSLLQTLSDRSHGQDRQRRWARAMFVTAGLLYAGVNLVALLHVPEGDALARTALLLDSRGEDGRSPHEIVNQLAGKNGVIMANNGQATSYYLQRPTISLVSAEYSTLEWDENEVRAQIERYHVRALVLQLDPARSQGERFLPSAFLKSLAQGPAPPWLETKWDSPGLRIFMPVENTSSPGGPNAGRIPSP